MNHVCHVPAPYRGKLINHVGEFVSMMTASQAQVTAVRNVGGQTISLELAVDESFDGLPGQFILLRGEPDGEAESGYFTISSPTGDESFEVTVGVDPDSTFSAWLAERVEGDTLAFEGPFGNISYDDEGDVVTIAGGPGIGAALAIAERASQHGNAATLLYEDQAPAHRDRLDALESVGHTVSIFSGEREADLSKAIEEAVEGESVYVFGYVEFCSRVRDVINGLDQEPAELFVESFG